MAAAAIVNLI